MVRFSNVLKKVPLVGFELTNSFPITLVRIPDERVRPLSCGPTHKEIDGMPGTIYRLFDTFIDTIMFPVSVG